MFLGGFRRQTLTPIAKRKRPLLLFQRSEQYHEGAMEAALKPLLKLRPQLTRLSRNSTTGWPKLQYTPPLSRTLPLLHCPSASRLLPQLSTRHNSTIATPIDPSKPSQKPTEPTSRQDVPAYEFTFTCKPCLNRSAHRISKQSYHYGSVLITCPTCKNRHVITDHLRIFSEEGFSIEEVMEKNGELFRKGTIGPNGDVEIWEDGIDKENSPAL